jgi:hypothetical protein
MLLIPRTILGNARTVSGVWAVPSISICTMQLQATIAKATSALRLTRKSRPKRVTEGEEKIKPGNPMLRPGVGGQGTRRKGGDPPAAGGAMP